MKPTGNELIDHCIKNTLDREEKIMLVDGIEGAFIGIGRQLTYPIAIYSYKKSIKILMRKLGIDKDEAEEYFFSEISDAFVGDRTPVFLQDG